MQLIERKNTHQIRKGDIIVQYGGRFECIAEPRLSNSHLPQDAYWPADPIGPSDCLVIEAVCIEGEMKGYFKPGSTFTIQGNNRAVWSVEVK